jgi:alpha-amylase
MVYFILTLHNHQPVGNFDFIFEMAHDRAYRPMLDVLYDHPEFKVTLHYSGPLLEWLGKNRPQFFRKLAEMIQRGQVEIMGGGFYEPILSVLPHKDKVGQIEKMNIFLKNEFGVEAKGFWLAERVWEPHLVKVLADCGLEYVVVDDSHFLEAGVPLEEQYGYYISEEEGSTIKIFPGSKQLRYLIPFHPVHETIQYIQKVQDQGEGMLAHMSDDGEKFGIWPGTFKTVYEEGWMESLISILAEKKDWIRTTTYTEYMQEEKPLGTIYLPCASYPEMMEWVLFTPRRLLYEELMTKASQKNGELEPYKGFFKGGFWRNFLVKYPESNTMHKKMLWVSRKLHAIKNQKTRPWAAASDELMRGQCNCAYWHGLFGGLYLPHLRHAIFHHLINSEREIDRIVHANGNWVDAEDGDYLANGERVILLRNPFMNMAVNCAQGGGAFEWDYKPKGINFLNNFSRTREAYHKKILESPSGDFVEGELKTIHETNFPVTEELRNLLRYDDYRRSSFLDHFWKELGDPENLENQKEEGDFVSGLYEPVIKKTAKKVDLQLKRQGMINAGTQPVSLTKTLRLFKDNPGWNLNYHIENTGTEPLNVWFSSEINVNPYFQDPERVFLTVGKNYYNIFQKGHFSDGKECFIAIKDLERKLSFTSSQPADWRWFPIETVSHSESQFEKNYQGTAFFLCWKLDVPPGKSWDVSLKGDIAPL